MSLTCIVVADSRQARFFSVEPNDAAQRASKLVEDAVLVNAGPAEATGAGRTRTGQVSNRQAGSIHPIGAQRGRHRLEQERRFGREIASHAGKMTEMWASGTLVLVAAPHLLGLMRETVRDMLPSCIELKELAKDYSALSGEEIRQRLALNTQV